MKYRICGADKETGESIEIVVEAESSATALEVAFRKDIVVTSIALAQASKPPQPSERPSNPQVSNPNGRGDLSLGSGRPRVGLRSRYDPEMLANLYACYAILLFVGVAVTARSSFWSMYQSKTVLDTIGLLLIAPIEIVGCVLLFRAWNQIQDGYQRTSPTAAVGFYFVPFFNLYWTFVAEYGLARDLNNYMCRHAIQGPRVAEDLALTRSILYCLSWAVLIMDLQGSQKMLLMSVTAIFVFVEILLWHQITKASKAIADTEAPTPRRQVAAQEA